MPATSLTWFPPAPAPGPASLLELPPDDWALEPKIDGIRVIILAGEPFTRLGSPLSPGKGAARLRQLVAGIPDTLDAEWVPATSTLHVFDLPDADGDYDERRYLVYDLVEAWKSGSLLFVESFVGNFPQLYESLRGRAEGVVLKRRGSLYTKQPRTHMETRDWLKRRFVWDQ